MREFTITDDAEQEFTVILNGKRCTIRLRYNVSADRWMMDLKIDEATVLSGRRLVLDVDVIAPYDFGVGVLFISALGQDTKPDRFCFSEGRVRMFSASADEVAAALAA